MALVLLALCPLLVDALGLIPFLVKTCGHATTARYDRRGRRALRRAADLLDVPYGDGE